MRLAKYKYYFRKPKSEIVKDILYGLLVVGAFTIASSSPKFWWKLWKAILKGKLKNNYPKKKVYNAFQTLLKKGDIKIERKGKQIYIYLTEKGKARAGWLQINDLKIKRPKKWDGKWRIVIFDISQLKKFYREAFRGKLKELGFYPLQKSVWVYPFDCQAEIELLREFFGFSKKELRLIVAEDIGEAEELKKFFGLS
jgi:DNA-binding transcriptional regulator PaaX